ncbi:unnamed protein product [Soboliphyme baturini]|uniref:Endo/exonuclease/phosphatase domain-containing protein n=1 Tax=Soboliphyme baturini TaxID=241478 RepID=A0A183JAS0_9BILA|nr:unnamed protein product [Soboliphyme baturini]
MEAVLFRRRYHDSRSGWCWRSSTIDWKPASGKMVIFRLKLQQAKSMTLAQVYAPNLKEKCETLLDEAQCALSEVPNTESPILMGDFNAHVGVDVEKWTA